MVAAGLLAKRAVERGLRRAALGEDLAGARARGSSPTTTSAPACRRYLDELGFNTVGLRLHDVHRQLGPAAAGGLAGDRRRRPRRVRRALRQPELRGAHPPGGEGELPRLAAARRRLRARRAGWTSTSRPSRSRTDARRRRGVPARPLAELGGDRRDDRRRRFGGEMFRSTYADVFSGDEAWRSLETPGRRPLRLGRRVDLRAAAAVLRGARARAGAGARTSAAPAASSRSATRSRPTTSRLPARSGSSRRPAATSPSTASRRRTSTRTARAAATTR